MTLVKRGLSPHTTRRVTIIGEINVTTPNKAHQYYEQLLGTLGTVATEAYRLRVGEQGEDNAMACQTAEHIFMIPGDEVFDLQDQAVRPEDVPAEPDLDVEYKTAAMGLGAGEEATIGLELDTTAQPPVLRILDLINGQSTLPDELIQSIADIRRSPGVIA